MYNLEKAAFPMILADHDTGSSINIIGIIVMISYDIFISAFDHERCYHSSPFLIHLITPNLSLYTLQGCPERALLPQVISSLSFFSKCVISDLISELFAKMKIKESR